jgi:UDP-N-acetyl-2-amino-2-deoxyglucuronate dehydrogenase
VSAQAAQPNGFPEREHDTATERELDEFYNSLPELSHTGHTGQIDDVLTALESTDGTHRVLVDGRDGRTTIEIITAIYQAAITAQTVTLPLSADDPFRTRDGLLQAAPRFHQKTASVGEFTSNEITT